MANEQDAPTRAEIESILWMLNQVENTREQKVEMLTHFLHERGLSDREIDRITDDLPSFQNWVEPVEEENVNSSTPASDEEPGSTSS